MQIRRNVILQSIHKCTNMTTGKFTTRVQITTTDYTNHHFYTAPDGTVTYIANPSTSPIQTGILFYATASDVSSIKCSLINKSCAGCYLYCVFDDNDLYFHKTTCNKYKLYLYIPDQEPTLILDHMPTTTTTATPGPATSRVILSYLHQCTNKARRAYYTYKGLCTPDYVDHHFYLDPDGNTKYEPNPSQNPIYEGILFPCTQEQVTSIYDCVGNHLPDGGYLYCTYDNNARYCSNGRLCSNYKLYLCTPDKEPIFIFEHFSTPKKGE